MRQLRVNAALFAFAVAPLVFSVCVNLATGGSIPKALSTNTLVVLPFLMTSAAVSFIYNFREVKDREARGLPNRPLDTIKAARPTAERIAERLAITGGLGPGPRASSFAGPEGRTEGPQQAETVDSLVADIWADGDEVEPTAYRAAWRLAALLSSANARVAIKRTSLSRNQLRQPRLKWLIRPKELSASPRDPLNVIQGRIGYLVQQGGTASLPSPSLIDPYLALALIAVRAKPTAYHSRCPVRPHKEDAEIIERLVSHYWQSEPARTRSADEPDIVFPPAAQLRYSDIGRLIRPELSHTRPELASMQLHLIQHTMRHFLTDELSARLFDGLPPDVQTQLAKELLTSSQWMTPKAWQHWVRDGRVEYSQKSGVANSLPFLAATCLIAGVVILAAWQVIAWIGRAWSWYFATSLLGSWPGWLKAFAIVVAAAVCVMWLMRTYALGAIVGIAGSICAGLAILASPVVRLHNWVPSWGTASTIVIGGLILGAMLFWLGFYYDDQGDVKKPVQLRGVDGGASRLYERYGFEPTHDAGHSTWCAARAA